MIKKLFTKINLFWVEIKVMQVILGVLAIASYEKCNSLGNNFEKAGGIELKVDSGFDYEVVSGTSITSGFIGGALGFAIICSTCLVLIVVLQKTHNRQEA